MACGYVMAQIDVTDPAACQAGRDWRHSEKYIEAVAMRMAASTSVQTIMEGI